MLTQLSISVAFAVALLGCGTRTSGCRTMVAQIHNDHIQWDGNIAGLHVNGIGEAERRVLESGTRCRPFLIEALRDDSRFAAAHVLLTQMDRGWHPISAAEWNHLRVDLYADGRVEIPTGQRETIQRLWTQR